MVKRLCYITFVMTICSSDCLYIYMIFNKNYIALPFPVTQIMFHNQYYYY